MQVEHVELRGFRNYTKLDVSFQKRLNLIIGPNGQGKTNLLEALSFALSGHSFRTAGVAELVDHRNSEHGIAKVRAGIMAGEVLHNLEIVFNLKTKSRSILIDGKRASKPALFSKFGCVVFSPESLGIIKEGPQMRRQTIDDLALSIFPENHSVVTRFERALKSRNQVLRALKEEELDRQEGLSVLESLNPAYFDLATQMTVLRLESLRRLNASFGAKFRHMIGTEDVEIFVNYVVSEQSAIDWKMNQVYDALLVRHAALKGAELASGQSLVGPHRHDVQFLVNGRDAKFYCSQGQQRIIVLALKLAQVELYREVRGSYPVLLLDDVFSELDIDKRNSLLAVLKNMSANIFLTTTDLSNVWELNGEGVSIFKINNGDVLAQDGSRV